MKLKKRLLPHGLTAILLISPVIAFADGPQCHSSERRASMHKASLGHPPPIAGREMFRHLDLNRSQRKSIRRIIERYRTEFSDTREAMHDHRAEMMLALLDGAEQKQLDQLIEEKHQLMSQRARQGLPMMQEIMAVLTDKQKDKLRQQLQ